MDAVTRRKLEMATRVRDFTWAHPFPEPSYARWLERLEDRLARANTIVATAELDSAVRDLGEIIGVLDGLNRYRFRKSPDLLAIWNSARDVFGPYRPKAAQPNPGDGAAPPQGGIAPAA